MNQTADISAEIVGLFHSPEALENASANSEAPAGTGLK